MKSDIYSTPESVLEIVSPKENRRSKWWFSYFVFWTCLIMWSHYFLIQNPRFGLVEYLSIATIPITILGIVGFLMKKKLFQRVHWKAYFYFSVVSVFVYPYITQIDFRQDIPLTYYLMGQAVSHLMFLPQYIALYLYAFKSNDIWQAGHA